VQRRNFVLEGAHGLQRLPLPFQSARSRSAGARAAVELVAGAQGRPSRFAKKSASIRCEPRRPRDRRSSGPAPHSFGRERRSCPRVGGRAVTSPRTRLRVKHCEVRARKATLPRRRCSALVPKGARCMSTAECEAPLARAPANCWKIVAVDHIERPLDPAGHSEHGRRASESTRILELTSARRLAGNERARDHVESFEQLRVARCRSTAA